MSIIDLIEKVREKPEMTRRRILVGTVFTITAVIFFFWLSVKLYTGDGPTSSDLGVKESGPIEQVGSVIGDFMQTVGKNINSIKGVFSASTTATTTLDVK